jgi:Zn-dependent protease
MSVWWWGSHTGLAYSTSGRTRVLYACSLIDIDEIFRFLRRKPRVLFALFLMESMCWLQFTLSVMVTPRYLADVLLQVIVLEWYTLSRWGSACWWRWGLYILLDGTACTSLLPIVRVWLQDQGVWLMSECIHQMLTLWVITESGSLVIVWMYPPNVNLVSDYRMRESGYCLNVSFIIPIYNISFRQS